MNGVPIFFGKLFDGLTPSDFEFISHAGVERVVFIGHSPEQGLLKAIGQVLRIIPEVGVIVRDRHDVVGEPTTDHAGEIRSMANYIRQLAKVEAIISNRMDSPTCATLVRLGEFGNGAVIIADSDPDGLLTAMKAAGINYDGLEKDAVILDGPLVGQTGDKGLSALGLLLVQGMVTLPPHNKENPESAERAKAELFERFARAAQGDQRSIAWLLLKADACQACPA